MPEYVRNKPWTIPFGVAASLSAALVVIRHVIIFHCKPPIALNLRYDIIFVIIFQKVQNYQNLANCALRRKENPSNLILHCSINL